VSEDPAPRSLVPPRALTGVAVVLAGVYAAVQIGVVRPSGFPAGAGLTVRASVGAGALADPVALRMARPPAILDTRPGVEIADVFPGGAADRAGLVPGDVLVTIADGQGRVLDFAADAARSPRERLALWRDAWWLDVRRPFTVTVARPTGRDTHVLSPMWFPNLPDEGQIVWLQRHAGGLLQIAALLASAVALVALGARGPGALLMTLTMLASIAVGGVLAGGEAWVPSLVRAPLTIFSWLLVPLGFPIVAMAVLMFPTPSPVLAASRGRTSWRTPQRQAT
jgi:hypothetical protein